ncbi:MAG: FIG00742045: hypothetical protein [uncultured Acetobacteraceae bacterium]|uniref:Uncharacterized protein n=1 Tax=uncultured Acetobacteraceae bacterium TaxID=169975 RepID=A0A6J4J1V4_9PROT|nr:MAG: FIG00742045: hypothetical protein [uncultured Acetobacteraceae bacterium]
MSAHQEGRDGFFIGWSDRLPRGLGRFLLVLAVLVVGGVSLLGLALSGGVEDPGSGDFDWAAGERTLQGVLTAQPYPVLWLPPAPGRPRAHGVLLSGNGKAGVPIDPATMEGRLVEATGLMLRRGTIEMMQVKGDPTPRDPTVAPDGGSGALVAEPVPLGRWRMVGEICDGKCYAGAMRPSTGLSHRACANLCLIGGIPPVFVSAGAIEGTSFFLMADKDGRRLPDGVRDLVALRVQLEGEVERRGDLLVFKVDLDRARVL